MSKKNAARSRVQIQRKKKVLQRMRTRELRKGLAVESGAPAASGLAEVATKTDHVA